MSSEREFKWLTAVAPERCAMCHDQILQGSGFYYESTKKQPHCRGCGRAIRANGYDAAMKDRNVIMKMFRGII